MPLKAGEGRSPPPKLAPLLGMLSGIDASQIRAMSVQPRTFWQIHRKLPLNGFCPALSFHEAVHTVLCAWGRG